LTGDRYLIQWLNRNSDRSLRASTTKYWLAGLILFTGNLPADNSLAQDYVTHPPPRAEFLCAAGGYVFVLSTPDQWKTRKSNGQLLKIDGEERRPLWRRSLDHEFRPRFVLVGNSGDVLLIDEWVRIESRFAIMLLDRDNRVVAQYTLDEIRALLDVPPSVIGRAAQHGVWIAALPTLDDNAGTARIEAGGKVLSVRLGDGQLSVAP